MLPIQWQHESVEMVCSFAPMSASRRSRRCNRHQTIVCRRYEVYAHSLTLAWLVNTPTNSHSKKYWPYNLHNTLCGVRTFASTMCIWYTFCYTFVSLLFISSVYRARTHTAYLTWGCATNGYRNLIKAKIKKKKVNSTRKPNDYTNKF